MKVILGKNAVLSVDIDNVFVPALCAIDSSFQFDHEEVLITSRNSGKFRERETRLCDWGFSLSGLTKVDNSDGNLAFFYLLQAAVIGAKKRMRLRFTDPDGNVVDITGYALVKQGSITSNVSGFSTATVNFPGTGAFTTAAVADPEPVDLYKKYLTTTPGEFIVGHADLADAVEIMQVIREDGDYEPTTGTPSGRKFKYYTSVGVGYVEFDAALTFNLGEVVYVLYKK